MQYTPMGSRERRLRRGVVLALCAIAWVAPLVISDNDSWLLWAVMWGVVVGLATACWGLLAEAPSRRDVQAARKKASSASQSDPKAT